MNHQYKSLWLADPNHQDHDLDSFINATIEENGAALSGLSETDDLWRRRSRVALQFTLPTLAQALDIKDLGGLRQLSVLEVGCGSGQKAVALARAVGSYVGVDLKADEIKKAVRISRRLGIKNIIFEQAASDEVRESILSGSSFDVCLLYAVLEHLTIHERINLLRTCWNHLRPGGALVVMELPNRLCPIDHHSTYLPFFDSLPPELAILYGKYCARDTFQKQVLQSADPELALYRFGRGASYHEFELGIAHRMLLADHIASDGWTVFQTNHNPIRGYERALLGVYRNMPSLSDIPSGFYRYWIDVILTKGGGDRLAMPRFANVAAPTRSVDAYGSWFARTELPVAITVPEGSKDVVIGFKRSTLDSEVSVSDPDGHILFQHSGKELSLCLGEHWNTQVYKSVSLRASSDIIVASSRGDAEIGNIYAR